MTEKTVTCLLCGSVAELRNPALPGYREPDTYSIYHCNSCKSAFSLPRTEPGSIYELIYSNAEKVPGYNRYFSYATVVKKLADPLGFLASASEAYWGVKESLEKYCHDRDNARIAEVGSGLGYLTYSLNKAGYSTTGIDISETAVSNARKRFGDYFICSDIHDFAVNNAGKFDFVISTEVIEHIEEPAAFFSGILRLLKPGGRAIITTPNKSFYPDFIDWASDLPPVHCWWLGEESIRFMAGKSGATAEFVDFSRFYMNNYKVVGLKSHLKGISAIPFFDAEGNLITRAGKKKNSLKGLIPHLPGGTYIFNFLKKHIRYIAGRFRELTEKDVITCSDRGVLLCAVVRSSAF